VPADQPPHQPGFRASASNVNPYDFRHSVATELTERSGNLLGVGYLLGHRHATTTNQYVHARRRAAESVLFGTEFGTD
jgi:site-specific recombinase XerC